MGIVHSKNYSITKKLFKNIFIQKIRKISFKKIIHFFEKLIIAQGYPTYTIFLKSWGFKDVKYEIQYHSTHIIISIYGERTYFLESIYSGIKSMNEWIHLILFIYYYLNSTARHFDENIVFRNEIDICILLISWFETRTRISFI